MATSATQVEMHKSPPWNFSIADWTKVGRTKSVTNTQLSANQAR